MTVAAGSHAERPDRLAERLVDDALAAGVSFRTNATVAGCFAGLELLVVEEGVPLAKCADALIVATGSTDLALPICRRHLSRGVQRTRIADPAQHASGAPGTPVRHHRRRRGRGGAGGRRHAGRRRGRLERNRARAVPARGRRARRAKLDRRTGRTMRSTSSPSPSAGKPTRLWRRWPGRRSRSPRSWAA